MPISTEQMQLADRQLPKPCGTYDELIARAEALIPVLRERADETDELRQLPLATKRDLETTGVARILQPSRYGGCEGHFFGLVEILTRVGRGCGSTAWCLAQYIGHNYMVSQWPVDAQDAIWGVKPESLISGILIPLNGKARRVDGGYRLTGRWPFVSGVNACDWCILSAMVESAHGADEERYFLMQNGSFEIIDTWRSIGLKGSGSHDIAVHDAFVPAHMTLPIEHLKGGPSPGNQVNTAPMYQMPSYMQFGILITSATLGIAAGMLEHYRDYIAGHKALMSGKVSRLEVSHQLKIAEAAVCVDSAKAIARGVCDEIVAHAQAGTLPSDEERTRYRAHGAFIGRQAWRSANVMWDAVMGRGVYENNPIERSYRDMCAATRHFTHNWDVNGVSYGRVILGLSLDNPSL
jgi:alkylation response protein AidB-like acyl-CoA dehydrogenase